MREHETKKTFDEAIPDGMIEGRNAVIEALRTETAIDKIYIAKGETDKTLGHIASKARDRGIVVVEAAIATAPAPSATSFCFSRTARMAAAISSSVTVTTSST